MELERVASITFLFRLLPPMKFEPVFIFSMDPPEVADFGI
jgi:hypothetical protein